MKKGSHTIIVPYNNQWEDKYLKEKNSLLDLLGDKIINIEHIGSTSVKGLSSKPIIDIVTIIKNFEPAKNFNKILKDLGYKFHSSSTERHFYRKGEPISYHLSIAFSNKGGFWVRQILFRDYLRKNDDAREEYQKLKKRLLKNDPTGVNDYFAGKDVFVKKILKLAGWKENQTYSEYVKKTNK